VSSNYFFFFAYPTSAQRVLAQSMWYLSLLRLYINSQSWDLWITGIQASPDIRHTLYLFLLLNIKNSSNGLFSTVRQKSACSDLSLQVILNVARKKKKRGWRKGKADLVTQFPSACGNVKPKTDTISKDGNHNGAMQARLPAFPFTYPTAKTNLF